MTKAATLNDLIAFQTPPRKTDDETVGQFLRRRLIAHAESCVEEPHVTPAAIVSACALVGADPIQLIFDQMDQAMRWDEPFRSHFFDDAREWFVSTDIDELMKQLDQHRERRADHVALVQAVLDGKVIIGGDTLAVRP